MEKIVIGTFFTNKEEDYETFAKIFEEKGYEVARQNDIAPSGVVIAEVPEEEN